MRYLLLLCRDEKWWEALPLEERVAIYRRTVEYSEGLRRDGVYEGGAPLHVSSTATTLRMKDGKALITDGPFAETKEQLGGYNVIEAKNLDEAIAIATRHPLLLAGFSVEVRPIREGPPQ